jgi:hypothetical protein
LDNKEYWSHVLLNIVLFLSIMNEINGTGWITAIAKSVPKLLGPKVWPIQKIHQDFI